MIHRFAALLIAAPVLWAGYAPGVARAQTTNVTQETVQGWSITHEWLRSAANQPRQCVLRSPAPAADGVGVTMTARVREAWFTLGYPGWALAPAARGPVRFQAATGQWSFVAERWSDTIAGFLITPQQNGNEFMFAVVASGGTRDSPTPAPITVTLPNAETYTVRVTSRDVGVAFQNCVRAMIAASG